MYKFKPLGNGTELGTVELTDNDLQKLRSTLMLALDYSPHTDRFRQMMQPALDILGDLRAPWMAALSTIKGGENPRNAQFLLDDWISEWRIVDYIDAVWTVAHIEHVPDPEVIAVSNTAMIVQSGSNTYVLPMDPTTYQPESHCNIRQSDKHVLEEAQIVSPEIAMVMMEMRQLPNSAI